MKFTEKIPVDKSNWIEYYHFGNRSVYIIEKNPLGNYGQFQYNGVCCSQGSVAGFLAYHFETGSSYFDPEFWYRSTTWGNNYPKEIVFEYLTTLEIINSLPVEFTDEQYNNCQNELSKHSIPAKSFLNVMLAEVRHKTGIGWRCLAEEKEDSVFTEDWFEARIDLTFGNKEYLLTWMNCD